MERGLNHRILSNDEAEGCGPFSKDEPMSLRLRQIANRLMSSGKFGVGAAAMRIYEIPLLLGVVSTSAIAHAAPATPSAATPATPLGNPGEWVTSQDYPSQALQDDLQGTVSFVLTIDRSGHVEKCDVTVSSGSVLLDDAACNLITQRALFSPARDRHNRPVAGSYSNRVRWVLPKEQPLMQSGELRMTFVVGLDGAARDCKILTATGQAAPVAQSPHRDLICPAQFEGPYRDDAGNPIGKRVTMTVKVEVEDEAK